MAKYLIILFLSAFVAGCSSTRHTIVRLDADVDIPQYGVHARVAYRYEANP